ncbi:MAG: hypothetical protein HeimC2_32160 [Candidatus Heimdallarchaeota archaeon LC_2]|nr:MAG: hypothetical protein HeimC2_32160 [Candidatus Heimdallarchaeota archaeon LC_2]
MGKIRYLYEDLANVIFGDKTTIEDEIGDFDDDIIRESESITKDESGKKRKITGVKFKDRTK